MAKAQDQIECHALPQLDYVQLPLKHDYPGACHHLGPCGKTDVQDNCACAVNRTWCFADCQCDSSLCQRKWPGCQCSAGCEQGCPCRQISFDCIPGQCRCNGCYNTDKAKVAPRLVVRDSMIKNANRGLFADQDIPSGFFLGEYCGNIVLDVEYRARVFRDNRMTLMALSRGTDILEFLICTDSNLDRSFSGR